MNLKKIDDTYKLFRLRFRQARKYSKIYRYYYHSSVDSKMVFIESRNGRDIAGNMLRILLEIRAQYGDEYRIITAARKESMETVKGIVNAYHLEDVKICEYESVEYFKYLWRAKYLFNDTTFPSCFIKKPEQVYTNTWHGTPLKMMGKYSASDCDKMSNVQRNLLFADYFVVPNTYYEDKMCDAYAMKNLYQGIVLHEGYPRNTVFFDDKMRQETRARYNLDDKKVYIYMPTFREQGSRHQDDAQKEALLQYFEILDKCLQDDEVFYVKLHYFVREGMDLSGFQHIVDFPTGIETYEFLNTADCLVTDYSSVFYDFANTGRKIIRFVYDEEAYSHNRGQYEQPIELPFPKVHTAEELAEELHKPINYSDKEFRTLYDTYDNRDATSKLVRYVIGGEKCCEETSLQSPKEKVLVYGGSLALNGITTSMRSLLKYVKDDREYYICWSMNALRGKPENIQRIRSYNGLLGVSGEVAMTMQEEIAKFLYYKHNKESAWVHKQLKRMYERENQRWFGALNFSTYIQFNGYDKMIIGMFQYARGRRIIFAHNDMVQECTTKNNHLLTYKNAYQNYDKVAAVSQSIVGSIVQISDQKDNIVVVGNVHDYKGILKKAEKPIEYQAKTSVTCGYPGGLNEFMEKHSVRLITIGRFSAEKDHAKLIEAFELFHMSHPEVGLIIIGGYGPLYNKTLARVAKSSCWKDIVVIRECNNPMAILKRCDLFVMTSLYEAQPVVLLEAAVLGIPEFATRCEATEVLMNRYNGYLVENTVEGVYAGLEAYLRGEVGTMKIDWKQYNERAVAQFESLFD